jgi:hypothetical protein
MRTLSVVRGRFFAGMTVFAIAVGVLAAAARAQNTPHPAAATWNLKDSCRQLHLEPTALVTADRSRTKVSLCAQPATPNNSSIVQDEKPDSIPVAAITDIIREEVARKPVQDEINRSLTSVAPENAFSTIGQAGDAGMAAIAAPAVILVETGALAPFHGVKTHQSSVRIFWTENGSARSTVLQLSPKNADTFLPQLSQATGKPWSVLRFDADAESQHASQFLVHFNQTVVLGNITTSGGNYRFLVLTSPDARHVIYIFHENIGLPQDAVEVLFADAAPLGAATPWKVYLARATDDSWCLSELHTNTERLQLHVCPAPSDAAAKQRSIH